MHASVCPAKVCRLGPCPKTQDVYAAGHRVHSLGRKHKPSGPAVVVTSNRTGKHSASNLPTGIRP